MSFPTSNQTNSSTAGWDSAADAGSGRNSWISSRIRVAELVFDATRASSLQLQFDGSKTAVAIQMQQVQTSGSYAHNLMVKARTANIYDEPWIVGNAVTIWFAKRDGFYAFRAEILAEARGGALVLAMPDGILRHCRRVSVRYRIPSQVALQVAVAAADGTWREAGALNEISTGGLSLALPTGMTVQVGDMVRLGLRLQADRLTEVNALVRHAPSGAVPGENAGLEFVNISHTTRLTLERYFLKTKAAPLPDIITQRLPALPESVRTQLCQATPTSVAAITGGRRVR